MGERKYCLLLTSDILAVLHLLKTKYDLEYTLGVQATETEFFETVIFLVLSLV